MKRLASTCLCIALAAWACAEAYEFPDGEGKYVPRPIGVRGSVDCVGIDERGNSILVVAESGGIHAIACVSPRRRGKATVRRIYTAGEAKEVVGTLPSGEVLLRFEEHVSITGQVGHAVRTSRLRTSSGSQYPLWERYVYHHTLYPELSFTSSFARAAFVRPGHRLVTFGADGWREWGSGIDITAGQDIPQFAALGYDEETGRPFGLHLDPGGLLRSQPSEGNYLERIRIADFAEGAPHGIAIAGRFRAGRHDVLLQGDHEFFGWNSETTVETPLGGAGTGYDSAPIVITANPLVDESGWLHAIVGEERLVSCSPDGTWTIESTDLGEHHHLAPSSLAEPLLATAWKSEDGAGSGIDLGVFRDGAWQFQTVCAWSDAQFDVQRVHVRALPNGAPAIIFLCSDGRAFRTDAKPDGAVAGAGGRQR